MKKATQIPAWFQYPALHWNKKHAIVIGAGIAGCQTAWHLVKQGWQVTLIEQEKKCAQQASGNPSGIISPKMTAKKSSGEDFYVTCFDYAIQQLNELKQNYSDLDWHACGLLQLAHNVREDKRWNSLQQRLISKELRHDFLQCVDQTQSSELAGIPIDYKASYFPQAGWINPVSFCEILLKDCSDNCQVILETDVINLEKDKNSANEKAWNLMNKDDEVIASAEVVIITSGKDLNQFSQTQNLPSMPVAGQTTSAKANTFSKQLKTTIGHEGYLTPVSKSTSTLTFGASFDRNIDKAELNVKTDQSNLDQLEKYLPQLAKEFTEVSSAHAAVRMTTPDRFPYVGGIADSHFFQEHYADLHQGKHYKDYPKAQYIVGLFVLGGLGSRGLTTSSLCAKVLTDILENSLITGKSQSEHALAESCHPARYIIKDLKRGMSHS